jgi:hypothetical protein
MTADSISCDQWVSRHNRTGSLHQNRVLRISIGLIVTSLQLDANTEIITVFTTIKAGHTRMPCTLVEWHELHQGAITLDQKMG